MSHQLEADIREALRTRAASLPPQAEERLLRHDYRPRGIEARRLAFAVGPLAAVLLAAGTIVVLGLGGTTSRALAGWAPSPNPPVSGQAGAAETACRAYMPTSAQLQHAREDAKGASHPIEAGPEVSPNALPLAVTDTRGVYTYVLLASGGERAACLIGPWPLSQPLFGSQDDGGSSSAVPAPGAIAGVDYGFSRLPDEDPVMTISGQTGAGVNALTLRLRDGTQVAATVARGWFVAWWPGSDPAVGAIVTTAQASTAVPLEDPLARSRLQEQIVPPAVAARRMRSRSPVRRLGG